MSDWWQFDKDTPEERQRDQVLAEIAAAEKAALAACTAIRLAVENHPVLARTAGSAALTHIATIAGVEGKTLWKHSDRAGVRR